MAWRCFCDEKAVVLEVLVARLLLFLFLSGPSHPDGRCYLCDTALVARYFLRGHRAIDCDTKHRATRLLRNIFCNGVQRLGHLVSFLLFLSSSDFQSEVGEVFGEIGGELPAKFGRQIFELLLLGKIVRSIFHQNSTANFTAKLHYEVLGGGGPYISSQSKETLAPPPRKKEEKKHAKKAAKNRLRKQCAQTLSACLLLNVKERRKTVCTSNSEKWIAQTLSAIAAKINIKTSLQK